MPKRFEAKTFKAETFKAKTRALPTAQKEIWPLLAPAPKASFILYGGTAIALHLGHRISIDFDFFTAKPLDKRKLLHSFDFMRDAKTIQEDQDTLVVVATMPSGPVKISYFGNLAFGHFNEPLATSDSVLLVASLDDLMATKLKTILDRAEAKDYRDIAAMISAGVSLEQGLGIFAEMFNSDPALPLKALGFFKDGDLASLTAREQSLLRDARDRVTAIPPINLKTGLGAD